MAKEKKTKEFIFPIKHFEDNLIFGIDDSCWGTYEMVCEEYDMLSERGKEEFIARLGRFIASIGNKAKIFIVPIKQDLNPSYEYELSQIEKGYKKNKDSTYEYAKSYVETTREILEEGIINGGGTNDYKVYVVTELEKPEDKKGVRDVFDNDFFRNPTGKLEELMGVSRNLIPVKDIEAYQRASERFLRTQSSRFTLEKVDTDTIQWLIGRIFYRGTIEEPYIRKNKKGNWTPYADTVKVNGKTCKKPLPYNVMNINNFRWQQQGRTLKFTDEDDNNIYQTYLGLSHFPESLNLPDDEWLKPLLDLPFGVEICISIHNVEHKKASKQLKENKKKIEGQDQHAVESGEVSEENIEKAYVDSATLEDELSVYNDPLTEFSVTIALADKDKEELRTQVIQVKQELETLQFRVQRPAEDVLRAFYEMIPGSPIAYNSYIHKSSPDVVATSVFPVAIESGDDVGHFIGTAGVRGKYIYLSPAEAIRNNRSGGMAILGTLGGGKSVLANYLSYIVTLLDGGRSLIIDPKSERDILWKGYLKEFDGEIGVTKIDYTDKGVFDPFVIYRPESKEWFMQHKEQYESVPGNAIHSYKEYKDERKHRAMDLANSMFTEELDLNDPLKANKKLAFQEALELASKFKNPSMELVIKILSGNVPEEYKIFKEDNLVHNDALLLARELAQMKTTNKLATLIIGDGTEKGLSFNKRINIMQIAGLNIPDPNMSKDDYSPQQRTSATIMIPLGEFAREFTRDPLLLNVPKAVLFDESWFLKATAQGALLYSEIARTGRSFFSIPIFIGHSVSDVDEPGIREALTYQFIFKMSTELEAKAALNMLQLEETGENIGLVMSLKNGQCLFRDFEGRVQKVNIVLPFENLIKAFETNPEKRELLFEELKREG